MGTTSLFLGIDIGSTTAKIVLRNNDEVIFEKYERHFSQVREKTIELLSEVKDLCGENNVCTAISGSAGLGISQSADIPFVQEVFATGEVVKIFAPDTSCVIELGGEDAKIIFFDGSIDERMNGSCAGGTGAFIDQMATLLNVSVDELDELSQNCQQLYPIASRCGVFAKTDIQPLLNQGARKEDIGASIYQAVVNQTIAGLAQGRRITGKVLFLGGPLFYCKGLRQTFAKTLKLESENAVLPDYARFAVALGASYYAQKQGLSYSIDTLIEKIKQCKVNDINSNIIPELFANSNEYLKFKERHSKAAVKEININDYSGKAYLGIDCGSTTTKLILLSENNEILYSYYASNQGNPVEIVRNQLTHIYKICGKQIHIASGAVTGYGEELIKNAFNIDYGIVETIAHYTAAKYFKPDVDFILDIGGQDIKCFKIKNGTIDSIMLNEACSSGCGSFLETFSNAMGHNISDFAQKGINGKKPVNLGSRCTVFMNSSIKQSQKDGATVEDISAGLSISVVKNAIYKVIRASNAAELGKNIVVQGGTFYNDAVLRAFEREIGHEVIRPSIAGLMGAYGAALYSKKSSVSTIISEDSLQDFTHKSQSSQCKGCTNNCRITVNEFKDSKRFISGNQCEKGAGLLKTGPDLPNLYKYKQDYLTSLKSESGFRGTVGIPLSLGMYELLPLWVTIFAELGFKVNVSGMSTRRTYEKGQFSIPSDTACYPAKIMHGHIRQLISDGVDAIFYPCLSYNINEHDSDNFYNCPVVAYYSELLKGNVDELQNVNFLYPYLNVNNKSALAKNLYTYLSDFYDNIKIAQVKKAVEKGFTDYNKYMDSVRQKGEEAIKFARENGKRIMILAGRPYHIDAEICHGIDRLANSLGFVVVSEDSICHLAEHQNVNILNQWTYHARLYRAARFATENDDVQFVQLVSFGCGVDAITTDEIRSILEAKGKYYTQIKIDEITNLGAVKIRLRSLIGALDERE